MNFLVNIANLSYLVSYSEKDIFWLRIFAVLGGVVMLPYYYLQPTPLMVPIYWGVAFIALNLFWVAKLFLERRPVKLTEDEQRLYQLVFRTVTPREMLKLLKLAKWEDKSVGETLIEEGGVAEHLSVFVSGKAEIQMQGKRLSDVREGEFIGEISFLTDKEMPVSVVTVEPVRQVSWHKHELRKFLKDKPELLSALELIFATDLSSALVESLKVQAASSNA